MRTRDNKEETRKRATTNLLLMTDTDSSDQCTGFFLCQEALDLKERAFPLKTFNVSQNISTPRSFRKKPLASVHL